MKNNNRFEDLLNWLVNNGFETNIDFSGDNFKEILIKKSYFLNLDKYRGKAKKKTNDFFLEIKQNGWLIIYPRSKSKNKRELLLKNNLPLRQIKKFLTAAGLKAI